MEKPTDFKIEKKQGYKEFEYKNEKGIIKKYSYVDRISEGSFCHTYKYSDKETGELYVFKIYKSNFLKMKNHFDEEKPLEKVKKECSFWSKLVNDHIARLYAWLDKQGDQIIAIGEIGDLGTPGDWNEDKIQYTIKKDVYELFKN